MAEDGIPPWVDFLSKQITEFRREVTDRLDKLVSRDAFIQEQKRVNEKFDGMGRDIAEVASNLQAESTARVAAQLAAAEAAKAESDKRQAVQRQTAWQWVFLFASAVLSFVGGALMRGLMP